MSGSIIVWAGQLVSVLASSMTQFALTIWSDEQGRNAMKAEGADLANRLRRKASDLAHSSVIGQLPCEVMLWKSARLRS